ncbi:surfactant protein B [Oesophagostomum dentatum]|uniref:Surfactant protein B n=1 Tax=Oesophagostomum dentatum TaxID=61180 RepID=A0A0B1SG40_OESDE|nr:surfactant protein B [Oesophagostomum dentatum]
MPSPFVEPCNKIYVDNLVKIIEKLKKHDEAEKVCSDLRFCQA